MAIKDLIENEKYVIIIDTNILLNVYRSSPEFSEFSLNCLKIVSPLIYLPATVLLEYEKHCRSEFKKMERRITEAKKEINIKIETAKNKILASCDNLEQLHFTDVDTLRTSLSKKLEDVHQTFTDFFDDRVALHLIQHSWLGNDYLYDFVKGLNDAQHILTVPTQKDIYRWCEQGEQRYAKGLPPGFKDAKNKEGVRKYSDLIIWKEIFRFAKEEKVNVIFVTDDVKTDWWKFVGGKKQFHPYLIKEFSRTGQQIQAFSSYDFYIDVARDYGVQQTDVVEIALRMTDDLYYKKIANPVFERIEEELVYNGMKYIAESSEQFGVEDIDEFVITDYNFVNAYQIERTDFSVIYEFVFSVELEGTSYEYLGRDDDTKEIIFSTGKLHVFEGEIVVQVERETNLFMDFTDDESFIMAFIAYSSLTEKCELQYQ